MFFSIVYDIDATCFNKCFLFHVIAERRYFFWKFVISVRFFQPPYCRFLSNKYFERSSYFTHLHNSSAVLILMLILSFKKTIIYYNYIYLKNLCSWLFYDNVFYGARKISPEENCLLALILRLILNQTLTLAGGQFSSGAIFRTPFFTLFLFLTVPHFSL